MTLALFQHCPIRTPVRRPGALSRSFFFSSRRRHTRCLSGWSSDVCSSDLNLLDPPEKKTSVSFRLSIGAKILGSTAQCSVAIFLAPMALTSPLTPLELLRKPRNWERLEIGRASCRERVEICVVDVSFNATL